MLPRQVAKYKLVTKTTKITGYISIIPNISPQHPQQYFVPSDQLRC